MFRTSVALHLVRATGTGTLMPLPRVGVHRGHFGLESRTQKSLASMEKIPRTSGPDDAEGLITPDAINFTEIQGLKSARCFHATRELTAASEAFALPWLRRPDPPGTLQNPLRFGRRKRLRSTSCPPRLNNGAKWEK